MPLILLHINACAWVWQESGQKSLPRGFRATCTTEGALRIPTKWTRTAKPSLRGLSVITNAKKKKKKTLPEPEAEDELPQEAESVIVVEESAEAFTDVEAPAVVVEMDSVSQTATEDQQAPPPVKQKKKKKKKKTVTTVATQEEVRPQAPTAFGMPLTNVALVAAVALGGIGYAMYKSSGRKTGIAAVR
eukprot:1196435-Prorocentrum_minimum.AAC.13